MHAILRVRTLRACNFFLFACFQVRHKKVAKEHMRTSVAFYLAEMNEITNEISYEERKTKSYRYFREFLKCDGFLMKNPAI